MRWWLWGALVGAGLSTVAVATPPAPGAATRSAAAEAAYQAALAGWKSGTVPLDTVYLWSMRWYASDGAADRHRARMAALAEAVQPRVANGSAPALDGLAVAFYLAEAASTDPEMEERLADLESKIEALEKRPGPAAASAEEELAASVLLKDSTLAMDAQEYDKARTTLTELREKYGATRAAKAAVRLEDELAVIGRDAVPVKVDKWFQGAGADVKGPTLYVFWEVWCPHCRREVPRLSETYERFKGQGLVVVGLTKMSRDITEEQVNAFIAENRVTYPIAKEKGTEMSEAYGIRGIPAAAMVKDGKVVWRGHPAKLTDDMIQGWL